jgi:hypothetical protein
LKEIVTSRDPGDWIDEQIADIRKKARGGAAADRLRRCPARSRASRCVIRARVGARFV